MSQITRLQTYYGIPGPNLGVFPTTPPTQPQITALVSCSLPGPKYKFPGSSGFLPYIPYVLLVGTAYPQAFWVSQLSVVPVPLVRTQITLLTSYSLPGPKWYLPTSAASIVFVGKAYLQAFWAAPVVAPTPLNQGSINVNTQYCQQNDIGLQMIYQFVDQSGNPINLTGATGLTIKIGYPDNTTAVPHTLDRTALLLTDGSDGKIYYITVGGDLNIAGDYEIQGRYTLNGKTISGIEVDLLVLANVDNN